MADKTKTPLFSDFPPVTTQEWMDKITADLKGASFEKKLVWRTNEGFNVQPFYRAENLDGVEYLDSLPGEFPYVRGTKKDNNWYVRQDVCACDPEKANAKILDILYKGVDSLGIHFCEKQENYEAQLEKVLKGVDVSAIEINFRCKHGSLELLKAVVSYLKKQNIDPAKVVGSVKVDPLGKLTRTGKACKGLDDICGVVKKAIEAASDFPNLRIVGVDAKAFNDAGSTIVQELGFALAAGNEYLAKTSELGVKIEDIATNIKFSFGVGGNYFMEIAKFRAARMLWAHIVDSYSPCCKEVAKMVCHAETSFWNKTIYDPYVNMLRSQTEAMSATIGGVDSLTVAPFDKVYKESDVFSERIARNQQLLLKEESHFNRIADPSAGSYYIENLTNSIAEQAWKLFLEVEEKGGYTAALKEGFVQNTIHETAKKRKQAIATRRENLLGTNQFPNFTETVMDSLTECEGKCACSCENDDQLISPLSLSRGAEEFETLRLAVEKAGKKPKVFMLTYGNLAMRLARSQFSGNFFACAGYDIIDNNGFDTVEAGVEAAKKADADIIVLCSSDDEYAEAAPKAFDAIAGEKEFVVAGAPACADELKAKGITNFVNVRSNVLEVLQDFNAKLGIK